MKKWITALLVVLIIAVVIIYSFIPGKIQIVDFIPVKCPEVAAVRVLNDTAKWKKWWAKDGRSDSLEYNNYRYYLSKIMYNAYDVAQINNTDTINSQMVLIRVNSDSLLLRWEAIINTGFNPFGRIAQYRKASHLKHNMHILLDSLDSYLQKSENIYDFHITITTLKDTTFISKKITGNTYPSTETIYRLVKDLKDYNATSGAKETNYPIMNIRRTDSGYTTMIAIAVDRELDGNKTFIPKRMPIIKDNTLLIEVHGGVLSVQKAFHELSNYMQDHHYGAPALPFESLVTDRSKEADTTKWVTRIYAPIM